MVAPIDLDRLPTIWCRDRYPWDPGQDWQAICEHEAQSPIQPNAARNIIGYLRSPPQTAGIHYAVDASEVWRGTDHRSPSSGRSPHCYRPHRWSVGIEHAGYTVPGGYDSPAAGDMLAVSALLHATLIDEWELREGRPFPLDVLDVDGVANRRPGLFTHDTATKACIQMGWPHDGSHYDGRYYPFDRLIPLIEQARGTYEPAPPVEEDDEMARMLTFFPPGSEWQESGLRPFVEVDWASGQVHGWHNVIFDGADADVALDGDLRTVDFVKLNSGAPIRDFRVDEATGEIIGFGQGGGIFRVRATAG
jgi:hypothetical protein